MFSYWIARFLVANAFTGFVGHVDSSWIGSERYGQEKGMECRPPSSGGKTNATTKKYPECDAVYGLRFLFVRVWKSARDREDFRVGAFRSGAFGARKSDGLENERSGMDRTGKQR